MNGCCESLIKPRLAGGKYGGASNLAQNETIKQLIRQGKTIYHFGFGQSPFPVLEAATEALKKHAAECDYLPTRGMPELRQAICGFHQYFDDLTFDPDDVVIAAGTKELLFLLSTIFNGEILVNSPSWTTYHPQAVLADHEPIVIDSKEEDEWRVTPEGIEQALKDRYRNVKKLLIFTNPCNPTGATYTEEQLRSLVETFRKHNIIVLSDEIYARVHYDFNHLSLPKYYPEGSILSTGFSKWASAGGWRLGYQIYPKELSEIKRTIISAGSYSYTCGPAPMQYAFAEVMQDIAICEEFIRHTTRIMEQVASFCVRELRSVGVTVPEPRAGYYLFPNFEVIREALERRGLTSCQQMCDLMLKEAAVAVLPGGPTHLRPLNELTTRLCFVNFDGKLALAQSRKVGLSQDLGVEFVQLFCQPVYNGILALKRWVVALQKEQES